MTSGFDFFNPWERKAEAPTGWTEVSEGRFKKNFGQDMEGSVWPYEGGGFIGNLGWGWAETETDHGSSFPVGPFKTAEEAMSKVDWASSFMASISDEERRILLSKSSIRSEADAIVPSSKGQPPVGKTRPGKDKGDVAKPQPRYLLKNTPVGKTESVPAGKPPNRAAELGGLTDDDIMLLPISGTYAEFEPFIGTLLTIQEQAAWGDWYADYDPRGFTSEEILTRDEMVRALQEFRASRV